MIKKNTNNKIAIISTLAGIGSGVGIGYLAFNGDKNSQELQETAKQLERVTNEMDHYSRKFHDKNQPTTEVRNWRNSTLKAIAKAERLEKEKTQEIRQKKWNEKLAAAHFKQFLEERSEHLKLQEELNKIQETNGQELRNQQDLNNKLTEQIKSLTDKVNKFEAVKRCMVDNGQTKKIDGKDQKIDWAYCSTEWLKL